jgi:hypothetical protein
VAARHTQTDTDTDTDADTDTHTAHAQHPLLRLRGHTCRRESPATRPPQQVCPARDGPGGGGSGIRGGLVCAQSPNHFAQVLECTPAQVPAEHLADVSCAPRSFLPQGPPASTQAAAWTQRRTHGQGGRARDGEQSGRGAENNTLVSVRGTQGRRRAPERLRTCAPFILPSCRSSVRRTLFYFSSCVVQPANHTVSQRVLTVKLGHGR